MKERTVLITIEIVTDAPREELRDKTSWRYFGTGEYTIRQVTANVQQPSKSQLKRIAVQAKGKRSRNV